MRPAVSAVESAEAYAPKAYTMNARHELSKLRAEVLAALVNPSDLYLKIAFVDAIDAVDDNLRKALR